MLEPLPSVHLRANALDTQLEQLRGEGLHKIYREKVTCAHSDRRELLKMALSRRMTETTACPADLYVGPRFNRNTPGI